MGQARGRITGPTKKEKLSPEKLALLTHHRWGNAALRIWARLSIDRCCLTGAGHSAWSAPQHTAYEDPDGAGAVTYFLSQEPQRGLGPCLSSHMGFNLLVYLGLVCLSHAGCALQ